jgi:hypothetical protein
LRQVIELVSKQKGNGALSANTLKHGIYSREMILPGERQSDYDQLFSELVEEWRPSGPTEREAVVEPAGLWPKLINREKSRSLARDSL